MKKIITLVVAVLTVLSMVGCSNNEEINELNKTIEELITNNNKQDKEIAKLKEKLEELEKIKTKIEVQESEIHFIDTGNSDSILIKQGDKAALIDGGDNDDEQRIVSYLKEQGVTELEYVFATHPHEDHIGGLDAIVDNIDIKNIYVSNGDADTKTYSDFIMAMSNKGLNPSVPILNSEFELGTSTFKVLSVANESEPNNNSLVLLYTNGEDKILLMGDAEKEIESRINPGDVDLLKIGHHGSNSSSSSSFISKVSPKYAVILVGENNKYGYPHIETMNTLKSQNIEVHRSDECGNIVFKSTGNGLEVDCKSASYQAGNIQSNTSSSSKTSTSSSKNNDVVVNDSISSSNSNSSSSTTNTNNPSSNSSNSKTNNSSETYNSSNSNTNSGGGTYNSNSSVSNNENSSGSSSRIVYANGGRSTSNKYHSSPTAHNMEGAIKMTEEEAKSKGYVACKICY